MGPTRLWFMGGLLAAALAAESPAMAADAETEARERFERAIKLYEDQDYGAALAELERAAKLKPSFKLFYNMGQVRVAMRDYAGAIVAFQQYLEQGGSRIPGERRDFVQKEIKRLEQRVARLLVTTDVPSAEVSIDDAVIGFTPLPEPVLINAGTRRITVRHPDYPPKSRTVSLPGRVRETIAFSLGQPDAAPPAAPTRELPPASPNPYAYPRADPASATGSPSAAADRSSGPDRKALIGWIAAGTLGTAAVVTGVLALNGNSDLADQRERPADAGELDSEASRVRTLAIATDVLAVGALAVGGLSLWWTLQSDDRERSTRIRHREPALGLGVGPLGASLKGRF
jgi:hypothetical protein